MQRLQQGTLQLYLKKHAAVDKVERLDVRLDGGSEAGRYECRLVWDSQSDRIQPASRKKGVLVCPPQPGKPPADAESKPRYVAET